MGTAAALPRTIGQEAWFRTLVRETAPTFCCTAPRKAASAIPSRLLPGDYLALESEARPSHKEVESAMERIVASYAHARGCEAMNN